MFQPKFSLFALSNDTTSGGQPSTNPGYYSGLDRGPSKPVQPPKDRYSITDGSSNPAKTVNATNDGEIC